MKTMLSAFAVAILIAFFAQYTFDALPFSSAERQSAENVRLD